MDDRDLLKVLSLGHCHHYQESSLLPVTGCALRTIFHHLFFSLSVAGNMEWSIQWDPNSNPTTTPPAKVAIRVVVVVIVAIIGMVVFIIKHRKSKYKSPLLSISDLMYLTFS